MRIDAESETLIALALRADGFDASEDGTGRGTPLVPVAFDTTQITSKANRSVPKAGDPCHPLAAGAHPPAIAFSASGQERFTPGVVTPPITSTDGGGAGVPTIAFSCKDHGADAGELAPTLRSMGHDGSHANAGGQVAVAICEGAHGVTTMDTTTALQSGGGKAGQGYQAVAFQESQTGCREYDSAGTLRSDGPGHDPVGTRVRSGMAVRRLTPLECERLQGFPDGWTDVKYRGKRAADGPRYKSLGNSMAVPVMRWILTRIIEVERITRERGPA